MKWRDYLKVRQKHRFVRKIFRIHISTAGYSVKHILTLKRHDPDYWHRSSNELNFLSLSSPGYTFYEWSRGISSLRFKISVVVYFKYTDRHGYSITVMIYIRYFTISINFNYSSSWVQYVNWTNKYSRGWRRCIFKMKRELIKTFENSNWAWHEMIEFAGKICVFLNNKVARRITARSAGLIENQWKRFAELLFFKYTDTEITIEGRSLGTKTVSSKNLSRKYHTN